jgi:hypothetical protein
MEAVWQKAHMVFFSVSLALVNSVLFLTVFLRVYYFYFYFYFYFVLRGDGLSGLFTTTVVNEI